MLRLTVMPASHDCPFVFFILVGIIQLRKGKDVDVNCTSLPFLKLHAAARANIGHSVPIIASIRVTGARPTIRTFGQDVSARIDAETTPTGL